MNRKNQKTLNLLIDTNILLDVFLQRKPYADLSEKIFKACALREYNGIIAAHSFTNLFHILRKRFAQSELRSLLSDLLTFFEVSCLDKQRLFNGLQRTDFSDFEDSLQDECAAELNADYIITRNVKDFKTSRVKAITPEEFTKFVEMKTV